MEEKKKPNNKLTVIVIVLVALVGILGGFLVYEISLNAKNDNKETTTSVDDKGKDKGTEKKREKLDLQDATVQMLNKRLGGAACIDINPLRKMARTRSMKADDLTDEEKVNSVGQLFVKEDFKLIEKVEGGLDIYQLNYQSIKEKVEMLYGPRSNIEKNKEYKFLSQAIPNTGSGVTATYDQATDSYRTTFAGIGGACSIALTYAKLESAYIENDTLVLVEKIIAPKMENGELKVYNNLSYEKVVGISESGESQFEPNEYLKLGSTVTYTFIKDKTGNYYFDHSELN